MASVEPNGIPAFVPSGDQPVSVSRFMTFAEDPSGSLTVSEVASGRAVVFLPSLRTPPFRDAVYWARIRIDFRDYRPAVSHLLMEPHLIGRIEVFTPTGPDQWFSHALDSASASTPSTSNGLLLFKIPTPSVSGDGTTVYVRFQQRQHPLQTNMSWVSDTGAQQQTAKSNFWKGIFLGALITLVLYNVFLLATTGDRAYFLYVYYLVCFTVLMGIMTGVLGHLGSPLVFTLLNVGVIHGGMWFFRKFLQLDTHAPLTDRCLLWVQLISLALGALALAGGTRIAYPASMLLIPPALVAITIASVIRWRQGFAPARFSVFGLAVHLSVSSAYVMQKFLYGLPGEFVTIYWVIAAATWEALCFSFALAYRIRMAEASTRKLLGEQRQLLATQEEATKALQTEAARRAEADAVIRHQEERLQAAAKLASVGELASLISHEINQPLHSISMYADAAAHFAAEHRDTPPELRELLGHIAEQAARGGRVVKSVRNFVSRGQVVREAVVVDALLEGLLPLIQLQAKNCGATVDVSQEVPGLVVSCDRLMVELVLLNIARNGLQAMRANPVGAMRKLRIEVAPASETRAVFTIRDSGPGLPAEVLERLGHPLYNPFNSNRGKGMGLGLSLCRSVAEEHGGELHFRNVLDQDFKARGAEFSFELPVASVSQQPKQLTVESAALTVASSIRLGGRSEA
ncbi:7TM diverse intracellular signaling domain-containing protein [Piscinibacter sp. HJYY11]|uniref:sensor histidine kinase n=1 Tax=Piscinibacter sp. HJYY11 TaxID=2801333 RepID=UPI00191D646A|nr:7TM diverse intracellular signaling domain-containing protein [Piscinibacter sp. HJYY11]MBL0729583.1 hypothetical protein [Piscinibacter sp. HJYY11]